MAKQLCDSPIRKGVGILVKNQNPFYGAADTYIDFYLTFPDRINGRCVMFTVREVESFFDKPEVVSDWEPDRGELHAAFIGGHHCWLVNLEWRGKRKVVKISAGLLNTAIERANKNPEDVTNPSWLMRVFG